ncbi:MAG: HPr(Ser) kinase/phosphatase [Gemmatimonadetes bacterium]|nr:HPr(Ser) kinase/phosphatase [Gemmatimonadota bacterium]MDA1104724.1 HPr(Ser) kinase/phosphatase [Gemmatimonadota bacterium]
MTDAPKTISVQEIVDAKRETLALELLNEGVSLDRRAADPDVTSPGLALAGYTARVPEGRMWVFGETEITYLTTVTDEEGEARLDGLFSFDVPAVFVSKGLQVPEYFVQVATRHGVPVLRSERTTKDLYQLIKPFLELSLAPSTTLHGSLASVYGVGLLFMGVSGVGKSECVLDLVERGHRLVADDLVLVTRQGNDVLIGRGHELQAHHMEIRGVGIIDISALFGVRAIRQQKRIEVIVNLELWSQDRTYSRTGLEEDFADVLGVAVPRVTVPLNPGKNITVISEVVAMNHLLKFTGVHSAAAFDKRLRQYLEQDYE